MVFIDTKDVAFPTIYFSLLEGAECAHGRDVKSEVINISHLLSRYRFLAL